LEIDRLALERSGVDTATAERYEVNEREKNALEWWRRGRWVPLFPRIEKRQTVDSEMRADNVRAIIKCVREWQKTDPDRRFVVRDHDGIMSVGELGILADAAEANLSDMAKLTRMFEYGVIEPTGEMLRAGVDALLTGVGDGRPATNRVERIWHAMEKARK
jgi:hypothetical protein